MYAHEPRAENQLRGNIAFNLIDGTQEADPTCDFIAKRLQADQPDTIEPSEDCDAC